MNTSVVKIYSKGKQINWDPILNNDKIFYDEAKRKMKARNLMLANKRQIEER